jgi:hypothetical protein
MAKALGWIAFCFLLFPAESPAQHTSAETPEAREAQFVALQADLFDEQSLTALPDPVSRIARMLQEIRTQFPSFANLRIPAQLAARTSVIVGLQPAFRQKLDSRCVGWSGYSQARSATLEIPQIDAITQRFGGAYEITCQNRGVSLGSYAVVNFSRPLHVPSLVRLYRAAAGVVSAENNRVIPGGVMPVSVKQEEGQWRVTLGLGAGDCPAGCTYREYHHFLVAPDSTVQYLGPEQQGELPASVPQEAPEEELEEGALPE